MSQNTGAKLRNHCQSLYELIERTLADTIQCKEDDDLGFMAITFNAKQAEHLGSLATLIAHQQFFDAGLIARTMVEGVALLAWASKAPAERPAKWRAYSVVFDLQWMTEQQETGGDIPEDYESLLLDQLAVLGKQFLKKGKGDQDTGDPQAYKSRWHLDETGKTVSVTDILNDLDSPALVDVYADLSCWIHWNARGLGAALTRKDGRIRIDFASPEYGNLAMVAGFLSALVSVQVLDDHLNLGVAEELVQLKDAFLDDFAGNMKS